MGNSGGTAATPSTLEKLIMNKLIKKNNELTKKKKRIYFLA